ncbi:ABC transporter ATP-binding protein [Sulfuracidifex metallicus]|uniref:ABC transporter ATP-binding protein n=1 Tax=Sulfuracidifex metallicus TaxID=47303 RepID=UPI0006D08D6F|nr:ABC transporter ATP-binding protein [Sulfuracidifex metallicus]
MKVIEVKDLSFTYLNSQRPAIEVDEFSIDEGESILITGKSGEGKSTFISCLNGVIPHMTNGELKGEVRIMGMELKSTPMHKLSSIVGTVLQDPEAQTINYTVEEEVAFGPENLKLPPEEIRERINESLEITGISSLRNEVIYNLSGGELQRTVIASILAMRPKILIFDEPTSNIDPEGTNRIFSMIEEMRGKKTIIIVEHKVERVLKFVDRVIMIEKGKIKFDVRKDELLDHVDEMLNNGIDIPEHFVYAKKMGIRSTDVFEVKKRLIETGNHVGPYERDPVSGELVMEAWANVASKEGRELVNASVKLRKGEVYSLMGMNGAGKSTFLKSIVGFLDKDVKVESKVVVDGEDLSRTPLPKRGLKIAYLPQEFDLSLITSTVFKEIAFPLKVKKVKDWNSKAKEIMEAFNLTKYANKDPLTLSMGQRRRVAMASSVASGAKIILMDEPTSGQDFFHKELLGKEIMEMRRKGYSFMIVTHDARFAYRYSDRIGLLYKGRMVLEGTPEEVFLKSADYGLDPPSDYLLRCRP